MTKLALRHMRAADLVTYAESDEKGRTPEDLALSDETIFNLCLE